MNLGGINLTDDYLKQIIGEKELVIITLSNLLNQTNVELSKARDFDMKITKLPDGRLVLEPEGKELEVMQWMEQRLGGNPLGDQINIFMKQREAQKDYDELIELGNHMKELDETERKDLIHDIGNKIQEAKLKKHLEKK